MKSVWGIDNIQDNTAELTPEQQRELREKYQVYANIFNTADGQVVLGELTKILNGPTWNPNRTENYGYYREGQNSIIRHILENIKRAKQ